MLEQTTPTYSELLQILNRLSPEQLKQNVTIYDIENDEYFPCFRFETLHQSDDVLDTDHPYIAF